MNRRRLLAMIGALSGGGAATMGTGAFTSVGADRTVSVAVGNDTDALLELGPCTDENGDVMHNGEYVQNDSSTNGQFELDLTADNPTDAGGKGVNPEATTRFDNVFEIRNRGTQPVGIWLGQNFTPKSTDEGPSIEFHQSDNQETEVVGQDNATCLGVGESICVGVVIRTDGIDEGESIFDSGPQSLTINADADVACGDADQE